MIFKKDKKWVEPFFISKVVEEKSDNEIQMKTII